MLPPPPPRHKYIHPPPTPQHRLLTLAGLRRRGVAPESINAFCREIGITRNSNVIPYHKLEHHVRAHLDATSNRVLVVLRPLRVCVWGGGHEV